MLTRSRQGYVRLETPLAGARARFVTTGDDGLITHDRAIAANRHAVVLDAGCTWMVVHFDKFSRSASKMSD
jgi:hypothetical protein